MRLRQLIMLVACVGVFLSTGCCRKCHFRHKSHGDCCASSCCDSACFHPGSAAAQAPLVPIPAGSITGSPGF